jgi:hypothetical protein
LKPYEAVGNMHPATMLSLQSAAELGEAGGRKVRVEHAQPGYLTSCMGRHQPGYLTSWGATSRREAAPSAYLPPPLLRVVWRLRQVRKGAETDALSPDHLWRVHTKVAERRPWLHAACCP